MTECFDCEREVPDGEPAWRHSRTARAGRSYGSRIVLLCSGCRSDSDWLYRGPKPCEGCGRPLYLPAHDRRAAWVCNYACRKRAERKRQRERRARERRTDCGTCGETFQPPRSDAKYCSDACKQKAYRERKKAEAT